jgi:hypothetical protein
MVFDFVKGALKSAARIRKLNTNIRPDIAVPPVGSDIDNLGAKQTSSPSDLLLGRSSS